MTTHAVGNDEDVTVRLIRAGIDRWLKLTEGLGLDTGYVESAEGILAATRFAVDAYVHFVRDRTPLEAIASSLTELFAPNLHEERISGIAGRHRSH